jgi:hypothetical protein
LFIKQGHWGDDLSDMGSARDTPRDRSRGNDAMVISLSFGSRFFQDSTINLWELNNNSAIYIYSYNIIIL